ncbi:MAG: hypothetical protein ACT4P2_14310 [Pseudomonadota bacterium]
MSVTHELCAMFAQPHRHPYVKATVRVHDYPDGRRAVFDGPRRLACSDAKGRSTDAQERAA